MTLLAKVFLSVGFAIFLQFAWAGSTQAITVSYGFDGPLAGHFEPISGLDPLMQSGGVLNYDNGGLVAGDHNLGLRSITFSPTYNQSWTASIEATIPSSYDAIVDDSGVDDYLAVGIVAFDATLNFALDSSYEVNDFGPGRGFVSADDFGSSVFIADPGSTTATIKLKFNQLTKVLSAYGNGVLINSVDIGASGSNWGMSSSDQFNIALFGTSENEAVSPSEPLLLDNFFATTELQTAPEPATLLLVSLGAIMLGLFGLRRWRL